MSATATDSAKHAIFCPGRRLALLGTFKAQDGHTINEDEARQILASRWQWPFRPDSVPIEDAETDFMTVAAFQDSAIAELETYLRRGNGRGQR